MYNEPTIFVFHSWHYETTGGRFLFFKVGDQLFNVLKQLCNCSVGSEVLFPGLGGVGSDYDILTVRTKNWIELYFWNNYNDACGPSRIPRITEKRWILKLTVSLCFSTCLKYRVWSCKYSCFPTSKPNVFEIHIRILNTFCLQCKDKNCMEFNLKAATQDVKIIIIIIIITKLTNFRPWIVIKKYFFCLFFFTYFQLKSTKWP